MPERGGLITTAELAAILDQPDLRLFDCTTYLEYQPEGSGVPYIAVPGRQTFAAGHIPGADFLDLQGEFSEPDIELRFMMPDIAQLEAAFGRHGVGTDSRVVLYSIGTPMWATRFWWMLNRSASTTSRCWTAARQMEGRGPRDRDRTRKGISAGDLHRETAGRLFRRQGRGAEGQHGSQHRRRQCAQPAIAQGPGAEPLWPAGPYSRQLQRVGGNAVSIPRQRPSCCSRTPRRNLPRKDCKGQARDRLLRRRHLRHHRPVPVAPARLQKSHAVRRLDGRMGEG